MKCKRAEDLFSQRYDNSLPPDAAVALDRHLAGCTACRSGYESFAAAVGRLRSFEVAGTPPGYAAQVAAAVFDASAPPRTVARRSWRGPLLLILSHAAAVLFGWGLFELSARSHDADEQPDEFTRVDPPPPVTIEVPVEKLVEVRVEVPVEVIKEVIVERTEYADRPVPNPLQLSLDRHHALLAELAGAMREALLVARMTMAESSRGTGVSDETRTPAAELSIAAPASNNSPRAPMVVMRGDGHVQIRTYGSAAEVIPSLIAALDDPDRALATAAEQHLLSIRARLAPGDGEERESQPTAAATDDEEPGGMRVWWNKINGTEREEPAPEPTPRERWQEWWNVRSPALADLRAH